MIRSRSALLAALAVAGTLAAGAAQARSEVDISWAVTIPGGPVGISLYGGTPRWQPPAVYVPQPVYVAPPQYHYHPGYHSGYGNRHYGPQRVHDRDRDGIPDHRDRRYTPRWDRDGDGVPNRHDRHPNRPGR